MESVEGVTQFLVELYDYALRHHGYGGHISHAGSYHYGAVVLDVADLDDGDVDVADESVTQLLGCLGKVEVEVVGIVGIDALAKIGMVLIGGASAYGVGTCEHAVTLVGG